MFIAFGIFAVSFVLVVLVAFFYLYPGAGKKLTTVPGPEPCNPSEGNLPDIQKAGSISAYLLKLHSEYGPIASYWMGPTHIVSVSTPSMFRDTEHLFDRPVLIFECLKPMISERSLQLTNNEEGRRRRHVYDRSFSFSACKKYAFDFETLAEELAEKLAFIPLEQRIPLNFYTSSYALTSILKTNFGGEFWNEKKIQLLIQEYHICMKALSGHFSGIEQLGPDSIPKRVQKSIDYLRDTAREIIEAAEQNCNLDEYSFVYNLLHHEESEEVLIADILTYLIGGFHTTANLLSWAFYYMAKYPDIQDKVYKEIEEIIGDGEIDAALIPNLKYTKQVLDETLRVAVVAPIATRYSNSDIVVGGHVIPKNTPIIHALGVSFCNEDYFPSPCVFDPDRFSLEEKKTRPNHAFQPFGFAGKRKCPGYRFAYMESLVFIAVMIRWYQFCIPDNEINVQPNYGVVTEPSMEMCFIRKTRRRHDLDDVID